MYMAKEKEEEEEEEKEKKRKRRRKKEKENLEVTAQQYNEMKVRIPPLLPHTQAGSIYSLPHLI